LRISDLTSRRMAALAIISVTTRPPPARLTARLNGMSVTPDIGAKMAPCGSSVDPTTKRIAYSLHAVWQYAVWQQSRRKPAAA
jgi:hypothetical protein